MPKKHCSWELSFRYAETHPTDNNILELDGYHWVGNNRKVLHKNARNGSVGVGFFILNDLFLNFDVSVLDDSNEGILWLKLSHKSRYVCILPCVCFLPPENVSRFFDVSNFYDSL